ncbi:hypothetical protein [Microvirga thermotolerans]|uniref:Flagellar FliJ protein n=1 Tax=Microvirga thermotolerans TaxID=2651334 RepID=A0A5P9K1Z5_9HYPH|nr:hypothetical protein [Microvirga thermotolerans]QFU17645.1 hypothetical protein GDR74_16285 [Microvirga thermotolerans]
MEHRLDKTKRLLKLQRQLHDIEKWKLARLQQKAVELQEAQSSLIGILNDDETLYGLFLEARAKRLQQLAAEEAQVKELQERQSEIALDRGKKVKRMERAVDRLRIEHRRDAERGDYLRLLDVLTARKDASLP